MPWAAAWVLLGLLTALSQAQESGDWHFDVLQLKNGKKIQGLILEETPTDIHFACILRNPGERTVVFFTTFQRDEIQDMVRLDASDRKTLQARLRSLETGAREETRRMGQLELKAAPWVQPSNGPAWSYRSTSFILLSNASEDIVRRAAVRLEQMDQAYTRFLPPRHQGGHPTTILLVRSLAEYHALLRKEGRDLLNPAFFDAAHNRIVCGSDLQHLGDELEQARRQNQQALRDLNQEETELRRLYQGRPPATLANRLDQDRQKILQAEDNNQALFQAATRKLFQVLYHEAFHAYLANFVYPPAEDRVPLWLNEGLAQIFETAILEAGELRIGHPDKQRLTRLQTDFRKGESLSLDELLRAGSDKFVVAHASDRQVSDRYYLTSWALAFYLTFDRKLVGTPALDQYVHRLKSGADPRKAFEKLVGQPLPEFEKAFLERMKDEG